MGGVGKVCVSLFCFSLVLVFRFGGLTCNEQGLSNTIDGAVGGVGRTVGGPLGDVVGGVGKGAGAGKWTIRSLFFRY